MIIKNWKKEIFSIPNLLSLFRLVLIPVYIVIYMNAEEPSHYYLSAGILAVSCLTDLIDGKIARHFNMITTLGIILDPFADKATQFTLIVCLAIKHPVLFFLIGLFILKEGFQLIAGGFNLLKKGKMLSGALLAGNPLSVTSSPISARIRRSRILLNKTIPRSEMLRGFC